MRFGESHGEACRFCGSTEIIVWPPSSAGNCAVCSEEALAWDARLEQLAARRLVAARAAFDAAEAEKRAAEHAQRWAARRAALVHAGNALAQRSAAFCAARWRRLQAGSLREVRVFVAAMQRARRLLLRPLPARSRTAHNF